MVPYKTIWLGLESGGRPSGLSTPGRGDHHLRKKCWAKATPCPSAIHFTLHPSPFTLHCNTPIPPSPPLHSTKKGVGGPPCAAMGLRQSVTGVPRSQETMQGWGEDFGGPVECRERGQPAPSLAPLHRDTSLVRNHKKHRVP